LYQQEIIPTDKENHTMNETTATKTINEQDMLTVLNEGVKGNTFVTISTDTEPAMRKTNNPYYGLVRKLTTLNGMIGFDYPANVNKLAASEGKEERNAKPRSWGEVSPCKRFIFHKGAVYLRFRSEKCLEAPVYLMDGQEIAKALLDPFLTVKTKSSTQADLDGEIVVRDFSLASIKTITFRGVKYVIDHEVPATVQTITAPVVAPVTAPVTSPIGWESVDV
jgi:hypothetical protein